MTIAARELGRRRRFQNSSLPFTAFWLSLFACSPPCTWRSKMGQSMSRRWWTLPAKDMSDVRSKTKHSFVLFLWRLLFYFIFTGRCNSLGIPVSTHWLYILKCRPTIIIKPISKLIIQLYELCLIELVLVDQTFNQFTYIL